MTEKNQEKEIVESAENPATSPEDTKTVSFIKPATLVGQMLDGRFLIEKDLTDGGADAGGIGVVYLAKDMKLMGKETVVKILQQAALENTDLIRKFQHEKEALIRIEHPNIVRILDSGTLSDGNPFMVMEYIAGYSLRRKLRDNGKLDFESAANIIESVTSALSVAHAEKVLHRDIKPENIMLTPQEGGAERVRLIDFGIARVEEAELAPVTTVPTGIGTIRYIAPEQLAGKLEQTSAVDIYSFAIVIYEMLTGKQPFNPKSVIEMFEMQKAGVKVLPRELREDFPEKAETILLSALAFIPQQRPQNARAFGRELATALLASFVEQKSDLAETVPNSVESTANPVVKPTEPYDSGQKSESVNSSVQTTPPKSSNKMILPIAVGGLILAAVLGFLGFSFLKGDNPNGAALSPDKTSADSPKTNPAAGTNQPMRELTYYLDVQKMRDEKPFENPFRATGKEIYESGYKFKISLNTDSKGFLYLFNEGKDEKGATVYNILFPTPKRNNGSAEIEKNGLAETGMNTFEGGKGTENVWVIWSTQTNNDLDSVKQNAFDNQGVVTDAAKSKLIDFIQKYGDKQPQAVVDKPNVRTTIKSADEAFAYKMELEHK